MSDNTHKNGGMNMRSTPECRLVELFVFVVDVTEGEELVEGFLAA